MPHKLLRFFFLCLFLCCAATKHAAADEDVWDVAADIRRLGREAPSLAAYPGADGIVWMKHHQYTLLPDGAMRRTHKLLLLLSDGATERSISSYPIPYPSEEGAALRVAEAAWFDPHTGEKVGTLDLRPYDADGLGGIVARIPDDAEESVVAVMTVEEFPMRLYLDDVVRFSDPLPVWEQRVTVETPEGMSLYWEGAGLRDPEKTLADGTERHEWALLNQPATQAGGGLVDTVRPTLLFSLNRGLIYHLKYLNNADLTFRAPAPPSQVAAAGGNLARAGERIVDYFADKQLVQDGYRPQGIRPSSRLPKEGPWTTWEQTLIAAGWLRSLGWSVDVFWTQKLPVGPQGATSSALWETPVLRIQDKADKIVFFTAGENAVFGKQPPSTYGLTVYRTDGTEVERVVLPKGSASDHTLLQLWKLALDENGFAAGTLDLTVTGAWVDALGLGREPHLDTAAARVMQWMGYTLPGLEIAAKSARQLGAGYRLTFDVRATLGIASGTDILFRLPGGVPAPFDAISEKDPSFGFRFPFVLEQNIVVTTPRGYTPIMLPGKSETGDPRSMLEESVVHWPKRRQLEAHSKWTMRTTTLDAYAASSVLQQLALAKRWSQTTIPFRK